MQNPEDAKTTRLFACCIYMYAAIYHTHPNNFEVLYVIRLRLDPRSACRAEYFGAAQSSISRSTSKSACALRVSCTVLLRQLSGHRHRLRLNLRSPQTRSSVAPGDVLSPRSHVSHPSCFEHVRHADPMNLIAADLMVFHVSKLVASTRSVTRGVRTCLSRRACNYNLMMWRFWRVEKKRCSKLSKANRMRALQIGIGGFKRWFGDVVRPDEIDASQVRSADEHDQSHQQNIDATRRAK